MAYSTEQKAGESLEKWYRRLAKTADQRLVRLESYAHDTHFNSIKRWAYNVAKNDVKRWSGASDQPRFNTKPPENAEDLLAKISDIRKFLEMKTSTKAGVKAFYVQRAKTINKNYGTSFSWEQLANYYESGLNKVWDDKFGSKTALKMIGKIQKNNKKKIKDIEADANRVMTADDEMVDSLVNDALDDSSLNIDMLV